MKVTAQEEYGLRCLVQLARAHASRRTLTIPEIAQSEKISGPYAGKLLSVLRQGGLVSGVRGRAGGYSLTRDPRAITLDEVLTVLGGRLFTSEYCSQFPGSDTSCVHTDDCNIRSVWGSVELVLCCVFKRMTLADMIGTEQELRDSLTAALRDSVAERPTRQAALTHT
jgi:Rrf2 family protein